MIMLKPVILSTTLAACAVTGNALDRDTAPHAKVKLDLSVAGEGAVPLSPSAIEPTLPSVDRIANQVRARLGDTATAELSLCVSPSGHVTKVELARSSTFDAFDTALLRDAETWQFSTMPGPASVQSCQRTTIAYRSR
jgi:TonB family protein